MRIDYRELKRRVRLIEVLFEWIGWESTEGRGDQLRGPCPLPGCRSRNEENAKAHERTFSVHAEKSMYRCFGCDSRGNILDFWQAYRGKSLRESALELVQHLETSNRPSVADQPSSMQHPSSHPAKMADS